MCVVGLGVLGLGALFLLFSKTNLLGESLDMTNVTQLTLILNVVAGFSLGASSIALFARVGGGIFTKAPMLAPTLSVKSSLHSRR